MTDYDLGEEPEDTESVEAVAEFRAWVESTFGVEVPSEWAAVDEGDEFDEWVRIQRGEEPEPEAAAPDGLPVTAVSGDVRTILQALGEPDGAQRLADLLGLPDTSAKALRTAGIELSTKRGKVQTIWVKLPAGAVKATYPRPERLIDGIDPAAVDADAVIAVLGPPEKQFPTGVRYVIGGRYLHFQIEAEGGISMLTLMVEAP